MRPVGGAEQGLLWLGHGLLLAGRGVLRTPVGGSEQVGAGLCALADDQGGGGEDLFGFLVRGGGDGGGGLEAAEVFLLGSLCVLALL